MPYIIHNNGNYLRQDLNGFSVVNNINNATKWKKIQGANNVLKTMCQNAKFKNFHFKVDYAVQENKVVNLPTEPVKLNYNIIDKIKEISAFTKEIEQRRLFLVEEIHKVELDIVDIEHAAEFYKELLINNF